MCVFARVHHVVFIPSVLKSKSRAKRGEHVVKYSYIKQIEKIGAVRENGACAYLADYDCLYGIFVRGDWQTKRARGQRTLTAR